MDKKLAGLLGAVATLGTFNAAAATPAAPTDILRANSYADLLEPIPNAVALLQAVDELAPALAKENTQVAQFYHHHHHHHHHSFYRRHHHSYYPPVVVVPRYRHHHHHHHHHHHSFYGRDY